MNVQPVYDPQEKGKISRLILEALPEWFGISKADRKSTRLNSSHMA